MLHWYYRAPMNFRKYLTWLTSARVSDHKMFVIGNSSVDYDSFFGSIILAYFLTSTTGNLHLPLIDCLSSDLRLRF